MNLERKHQSAVWEKLEIGWQYRIDGDELIFRFKNDSWLTVMPYSSEDLIKNGLDVDYYANYNDDYKKLVLVMTIPSHPWTGDSESRKNNVIVGARENRSVAEELGISGGEFQYLKDLAQFIFYKRILKKK